jgi:hypothetical protein
MNLHDIKAGQPLLGLEPTSISTVVAGAHRADRRRNHCTLATDPNAEIKVRIEIEAVFANGVQNQTKRTISENAKTPSFTTAEWE